MERNGPAAPPFAGLTVVYPDGAPPHRPPGDAGDAHWRQRTTDDSLRRGNDGEVTGRYDMSAEIETKSADNRNHQNNHDTL